MITRINLDPVKDEIYQQWDTRVPKSNILEWIHKQGDPYTTCSLSTSNIPEFKLLQSIYGYSD